MILSARIIPGNEKADLPDDRPLFRRRVLVYYEGGRSAPIHVSGHASQEEMKILLQLVRPKYFVPIHGEYRQLFQHAALAEQVGAVVGRDFPARKRPARSNSPPTAALTAANRFPRAACCVDSGSLEEIEEVVIRDRRHLSEDGVVVPIIAIDKHTGRWKRAAKSSRAAFCPSDDGRRNHRASARMITVAPSNERPEEKTDWGVIKEKIRVDLKRYLNRQTSKRPLILPVILEI